MAITLKEYGDWVKEVLDPLYMNKEDGPTDDEQAVMLATVNTKLRDVLNGRKMLYMSTDWKDVEGLIDDILNTNFDLRHASKHLYPPFYEISNGGEHGGTDDYVLIAIAGEATQDELDVVFDLTHNLGAEEIIPPKPKCPKCGKEIELLSASYQAIISGYVSLLNGELNHQLMEEVHLWELCEEDSAKWYCPECDAELFHAGQEHKLLEFLKGGQYVEGEKKKGGTND